MFSSPKASFNVLIYMHRYNENTINIILNEYLRHYREKLTNLLLELENISNSESKAAREKIQAVKDIDKTKKILKELSDYEQAILFPAFPCVLTLISGTNSLSKGLSAAILSSKLPTQTTSLPEMFISSKADSTPSSTPSEL